MFRVGNLPILASEMEVLLELKQQLEWAGISLFAKFKQSGANIQFNCPIHAGGQEQRPSCGITIEGGKAPAGLVHCFTCGYSATLEEMISHCFGYDDMGRFGRDWLIKNFVTVAVENREDLQLDLGRTESDVKIEYVSEEELESYRFYHPYMWQRGFTPEVVELFDVGYDKKTNSLTFR
jgi:DNA primase